METFVSFLVLCQVLGALIGGLQAVRGEMAYLRMKQSGRKNEAESAHLLDIAKGLRFGMPLLLVASYALVVVAFIRETAPQPAFTAGYWAFVTLALLVILLSWALSRRYVSFALGSATIFTGWWFLVYLVLETSPESSFGATAAFFVVLVAFFYGALQYMRSFSLPLAQNEK